MNVETTSSSVISELSVETTQIGLPQDFIIYIKQKSEVNGDGGRPNFLQVCKKEGKDPLEVVLDILELNWLKNRTYRKIATKFNTSYHTIFRLLRDCDPWKKEITTYLLTIPRRKNFFNANSETSDYEIVQNYIDRAKRDKLKSWLKVLQSAEKCWKFLKYKDPARWTANDVVGYLDSIPTDGARSGRLDSVRQIAIQIRDQVTTRSYRKKIQKRKKEIFGPEYQMMRQALKGAERDYELLVLDLHVSLGAREGTKDTASGICGLSWDRFHKHFSRVDLWESKGELWSRDCPVDLFFLDLPERLRDLWIESGKPQEGKVILGGYKKGLLKIYETIKRVMAEEYRGNIEPSVFKQLTDLKPHDADKIHVNLCWEAGIPIEVVAGDWLGGQEGNGLCGRIWKSTDTIKRYYLALNKRSKRMAKIYGKAKLYAKQFNGDKDTEGTMDLAQIQKADALKLVTMLIEQFGLEIKEPTLTTETTEQRYRRK